MGRRARGEDDAVEHEGTVGRCAFLPVFCVLERQGREGASEDDVV